MAGRACGLEAVTAVSYLGGAAAVGGGCGRPGVAGIFVRDPGGWQLVGPTSPELRGGRIEVVSLRAAGGTLVSLLSVTRATGTELVAAWTSDGEHWTCSRPLSLAASEHLGSVGPATGTGLFALLDDAAGGQRLAVVTPDAGWQALPSPPADSVTVAFTGARVDALSVRQATLTVWALAARNDWTRAQTVHVPIQYGSSS